MDGNWIALVMAAAAAAGVVAAVISGKKKAESTGPDWSAQQIVVDIFDGAQAKAWFQEKSRGCAGDTSFLVTRLTPDMQKRLRIGGEALDPEHYLILAVMENNTPRIYQMVNFDRLAEPFCQALDQCGGKMIFK